MRPLLLELSRKHEFDERFTPHDQLWTDQDAELTTKWSFSAAVLYALTVITSTGSFSLIIFNNNYFQGYDHVTPTTDAGRLFTVFFGLVGIPLMFITVNYLMTQLRPFPNSGG
jgi:hypothetical protein